MEEECAELRVQNESPKEGEPLFWENEIVKENTSLQQKYEELMKEIEENGPIVVSFEPD